MGIRSRAGARSERDADHQRWQGLCAWTARSPSLLPRAVSGALLWKKNLADEYQIDESAAISTSPLIEGALLILLIGGKPDAGVVALDKDSGKEAWRSLDEYAAHSSPIMITAGGSRQLIVWTLESVTSLDPATGKPYWREKFNAGGSAGVVPTPVISGSRLLVNGLMLNLDADKLGASVLWPARPPDRLLSSTSTGLLLNDYLYCGEKSGQLVCREASTGKEVWQTDKATDSNRGSRASIHLTLNGMPLIEPTAGYRAAGPVCWEHPAFANKHVFARNDRELVCVSLAQETATANAATEISRWQSTVLSETSGAEGNQALRVF
ncbi:MAG TPA: PQQ-binding-like beta-propeller repeat protein [Pirellulales bacterium]|nr:PQQ-binding-like beta-propeller repeat protein [Pirellulales bacterium]